MNQQVKETLTSILERFRTGDIPEAVAFSMFPKPDIPSARWSLLNRTIMFLSGTYDARGYKQWQAVNRYVKKGSKALYILVPYFKKREDETGEEIHTLLGFGCQPVFKFEDTGGELLEYEQISIPELPLIQKAVEWGISVKAIPGDYSYYGFYSAPRKEIALATPEEKVFFHELSHAAHEKVKGSIKSGQDPLQEIVAELSAASLCMLAGKTAKNTFGNSYRYIERYAEKLKMSPYTACLRVMSETEKVLKLILDEEPRHEPNALPQVEAAA
jgi:hypothetical protein